MDHPCRPLKGLWGNNQDECNGDFSTTIICRVRPQNEESGRLLEPVFQDGHGFRHILLPAFVVKILQGRVLEV